MPGEYQWLSRSILSVGLGLCLAAGPAAAEAERDLTALSLEELAQTKVSSVSKTEEPRFRTPAAVQVLGADEIRRAGVTSLPEALRLVPGVHVARINASQWAIGIRGFTSRLARSQLALIDGRTLYNPLFAGTYWEAQDTALEDIERIEVVRGPGGTLWGANAVNGIINIITKDAKDTQGWLLSGGAGNEERGFVQARYGGALSDTGHYRVYGKYFSRDAEFHRDGDDFDGWHVARGGFRSDFQLNPDERLTVQGDAYTGRLGERTTLSSYEPPLQRTVTTDAEMSGGNVTAHWARPLKGSQLSLLAYYDRTRRAEPSFEEVRDTLDLDLQDQVALAEGQRLVFGVAYRWSRGRGTGTETTTFVPPDRTDHIFSAFAQDEIEAVKDRLRFSLGLKVERNQYTGFELQPSARAVFSPGSRHAVWAAVTRAVRTPSRLERDLALTAALSPTRPIFVRLSGDDTFGSEGVLAFEAGYRAQAAKRLSFDLALFHNQYRDLLSLESGTPFAEGARLIAPLRFANGLEGRSSGAELTVDAQLASRWVLRTAYAYLNVHLEPKPGSTDTTQAAANQTAPRHKIRLQSSWSVGVLDTDLTWRWVGRLSGSNTPAYSALDARVGWQLDRHLELAAVGQNLLSPHHPEFGGTGAVEVQRSLYADARWRW
jgi:iron complex outermembrane receptor protein